VRFFILAYAAWATAHLVAGCAGLTRINPARVVAGIAAALLLVD
jgi:hypothetical protein